MGAPRIALGPGPVGQQRHQARGQGAHRGAAAGALEEGRRLPRHLHRTGRHQHPALRTGPDQVRHAARAPAADLRPPDRRRVDRLRRRAPPARHLRGRGRQGLRHHGADQPGLHRLVPPSGRDLREADHRPAARRAGQPPRAAPQPRTIRGGHGGQAHPTSWYTRIFEWHPVLKPAAVGALALGAAALLDGRKGAHRGPVRRAADAIGEASGWLS